MLSGEVLAKFIINKVSNGISAREDLKKECFSTGFTENENVYIFDQWGGLLRFICERGFLCYAVREKKEFMICPVFIPMSKEEAIYEQAIRYFKNFGPATIKDAAYYFGYSQTFIKTIIKKLPLSVVQADGKDYYYHGSIKDNYPEIPKCIFLAGFDQLMLGYQKNESVYLPKEYLRGIYYLSGIIMPSILLNGRVVGKWQKKNKKLMLTLFENITGKNKQDIISASEVLWNDINKIEWILK